MAADPTEGEPAMGEHSRHQEETNDQMPNQNMEELGVLSPDEMKSEGGGGGETTTMRTWDGAGNPIEHVVGPDDEGRLSEGTGPTREAATESMRDPDQVLGEDATPSSPPA